MFMVILGLVFGDGSGGKLDVAASGQTPLTAGLERSGAVNLQQKATAQDALAAVKDGKDVGAVVVEGGKVTLYYSNTYPSQAATLRGIVQGTADAINLAASDQPPVVTVEAKPVESSSLKYIDFLVPGLLAMALAQSAVFAIAGTLVAYRELGIFRRLKVTPLPLKEFAFARLVAMLALALAQTVVLLGVGRLMFGIHLGLNFAALVPLVVLGSLSFIAIGLFVGAVAKTQETAAALANVITLPMVFLAGVFFPLTQAPGWLQTVSRFLPLTYLADGLRNVAIRGDSFGSTLPALAVLGGVTVAISALALRLFRWDSI
jgi:ABC-2 type transport system permease protein